MTQAESLKRRVLRGFSFILIGDLMARGLGYFLLPIYLHWMDKGQVGDFTYATTLAGSISQIALFGLYAAQSKLQGEATSQGWNRTLAGSVLIGTSIPLLCLAVTLIIWPTPLKWFIQDPLIRERLQLLIPAAITTSGLTFIYTNFLTASGQFRVAAIFAIIRAFMGNGLALLILSAGTQDQAAARLACVVGADLGILSLFAPHYFRQIDLRFAGWEFWQRCARISTPIWAGAVVGLPLAIMDRIMLDRGARENMADYNVASLLSSPLTILFASFNSVWLPSVLSRGSPSSIYKASKNIIYIIIPILLGIGGLIIAAVWGMLAIKIIPERYAPVLPLLVPLLIAQGGSAAVHHLSIPFYALEKTWILLAVSIPVAVIFTILCAWIIPQSGATAAAWLQLAPPLLTIFIYFLIIKKEACLHINQNDNNQK